jgi:hypothetical protein
MNTSSNNGRTEQPGTKVSAPFWLQSTLGDYEVEEVNMWELATLLAQAQGKALDAETVPGTSGS